MFYWPGVELATLAGWCTDGLGGGAVGYQNPPIRWSELEQKLSDRSRPSSNGGRPVEADVLTGLRNQIPVCRYTVR